MFKSGTIWRVRVIVGTYRKQRHIRSCLRSLRQYVVGISDLVFVDDSGDERNAAWLSSYGRVVTTGASGYNVAMNAACEAAEGEMAFWVEEDFTFLSPVSLDEIATQLWHRPHLAQIALLRGPWFPIEHTHGGLIEALQHKGHTFTEVSGLIEHCATFTGNPSVWRGDVWASGWPKGRWSEDRKRDELITAGYRFAYLPGIRVQHNGERSGFGY